MSENQEKPRTLEDIIWDGNLDEIISALESGIDLEAPMDEHGDTLLHMAILAGSLDVVKLLVEQGANIHRCTNIGNTLLHTLAMNEYPDEMLPYLLEKGLKANARNLYGWTPVHYAVSHNNPSLLKLLLEKGGNPHYPTTKGETTFDVAEEFKYTDMQALLEEYRDKYQPPDPEDLPNLSPPEEADEEQESITLETKPDSSSDLIIQEDHSLNQQSLDLTRQVMDTWANSIPHHGIKDFGQTVKIKSLHYRPAYLMGLNTLYDNRAVKQQSVPYTGQTLPKREYSSPSDVNVWDFELMTPDNFQSSRDSYVVTGSQYVETCSRCSGQGKLTCPRCHGKGKDTCSSCGGRGETSCGSCYGRGTHNCSSCGGSGQTSYTQYHTNYDSDGNSYQTSSVAYRSCSSCGGRGKRTCSSCGGSGKKRCNTCGGTGIITCGRCHGSGAITCPTCQGRGKMYNYYTIDQTLQPQLQTECILESNVFQNYPKFYIDPQEHTGAVVMNDTASALPLDLMDQTHLYEVYKKSLAQSQQSSPFDGRGGKTRLVLQQNRVIRMDVYDAEYDYEGKAYRLLVWGWGEDFQAYAMESPFSELRDQFLEKAEKRFKARIWGKAFNWLDKADDMDVFDEEERIYELKEKAEQKMYRQYRFGLITGSLISGYLGSLLSLKFFRENRFFHPWVRERFSTAVETAKVHPYVMTGLFLVMLLLSQNRMHRFMKKYYNNKIRHEWIRWLFSPMVALLFSMMILAGLWAVNASGISLILTRVVQLFINLGSTVVSWFGSSQ